MRHVELHGILGDKFGSSWNLAVSSPGEAFRAIEANNPGFMAYLIKSEKDGIGYRVLVDNNALDISELLYPFSVKETLHVIPVITGSGKDGGGVLKVIVGGALIAATFFQPELAGVFLIGDSAAAAAGAYTLTLGSLAFSVGANLILGGVAQMIAPSPVEKSSNPSYSAGETKQNYYFNGPVNTVTQGGPIPVGYGELIIGSIPISVGLHTNQVL